MVLTVNAGHKWDLVPSLKVRVQRIYLFLTELCQVDFLMASFSRVYKQQ